jgi:hypothetical protein
MVQKTSLQLIQALHTVQKQFHSDPNWDLIFSNGKNKWYYLTIGIYKNVYYVSENISGNSVEINKDGSLIKEDKYSDAPDRYWITTFDFAIKYIATVNKNWVAAYTALENNFPYKYRRGIIHHSIARHYCDTLTRVDKALGKQKMMEFIKLVESDKLNRDEIGEVKNLTANKYYEYCKVVYLNSNIKMDAETKALSGKELYKIFADGRHEGLLDIKQNSAKEFKQWIEGKHPKYNRGGHPWEIIRNNVILRVTKKDYNEGANYNISLGIGGSHQLAETLKIFLGLYKAKLFVSISEPKEIRERLLGQDSIGILPEFESLHINNHNFDENIFDVEYLNTFKNNQNKIIALAAWEQLPCLVAL